MEGFTKAGERIDWYAATYTDPAKPQFAVAFRNIAEPKGDWEAAAKKTVAIIVDGNRHELKPYQALVSDDGESVDMVCVVGPRTILKAIAGAKAAEIEFGGKRYELSDVALANCRELLKRSEAKQ